MRAPRMIPRTVSSLILSPARKPPPAPSPRAILFSQIDAGAGRRRCRVAADRLPAAVVVHPHVGQHDAILDDAAEIFKPPPRLDRADHEIVEDGRVLDLELDRV